jgi:hypothetical protein
VNPVADEFDGFDLVWIGADESDNVAAFITAGSGFIPPSAQAGIGEVENLILEEPPNCECKLHIDAPITDSYVELAKRGYFVFDWADVGVQDSYYELAAQPTTPVRASDLPTALRAIAERTRISSRLFSECEFLEVARLTP